MSRRYVESGATVSDCGVYRYRLWRTWDVSLPRVVFAMLNPSTADHRFDDPTVRKCVGFATRWSYGGIEVVNLFAFRATDPKELRTALDPVGPENRDRWEHALLDARIHGDSLYGDLDGKGRAPDVICAWGGSCPTALRGQAEAALGWLDLWGVRAMCLGTTETSGDPRHPLMLPYATELQPFGVSS